MDTIFFTKKLVIIGYLSIKFQDSSPRLSIFFKIRNFYFYVFNFLKIEPLGSHSPN